MIILKRLSIFKKNIKRGFSNKNIPFNFEGVNTTESDLKSTREIKGLLAELFGSDVTEGFVMAYNGYVDSLVDQDFDFIDDICEPSMSQKIKRNMASMDIGENNYLIKKPVDESIYELSFSKITLILGAGFNRLQNPPNLQGQEINLPPVGLEIYLDPSMNPLVTMTGAMPRIFQVAVEIKTNVGLQIVSKDYVPSSKDIIENSKSYTHKMLMEIPAEKSLDMGSTTMLMGKIMSGAFQNPKEGIDPIKTFFIDHFMGKEFDWYISDFDNLMMGNRFK